MSAGSKPAAKPFLVAEPIRRLIHSTPLNGPAFITFSAHKAAAPATCGVAMLVPLMATRPPPSLAEKTPTPGAETLAKVFENHATAKPAGDSSRAATEITPSATAGGATAISYAGLPLLRLSLPAAATMSVV